MNQKPESKRSGQADDKEARRDALKKFGRLALYSAPAVATLLTSRRAAASP